MNRVPTGNVSGVLETVWMNEGISRVDLAQRLRIDKSTVSHIVGKLIAQGLIEEYDQASSSPLGGRRPVKLRLNRDFGSFAGIEIQPGSWRLVVVNPWGETIHRLRGSGFVSGSTFEDRVHQILEQWRSAAPGQAERCLGLGIAVSGIVNPEDGTVIRSVNLGLRHENLLTRLSKQLSCPVYLENDANAACWGEVVIRQSIRPTLHSFLFCLVEFPEGPEPSRGAAVGLGFVVQGQIHHGENYSAGEFKSLGWNPGHSFQFGLNDDEMAQIPVSAANRTRFLQELADHILFLSRVFNLNHVFFGGADPFHSELEQALERTRRRYWPEGDCPSQVRFSTHGLDAVAYGAACLGLTRFFRQSKKDERLAAPPVSDRLEL